MDAVTIAAPARLHLGFFDLNGALGRRFGSLGVAISGVETRLSVHRQTGEAVAGEALEQRRAERAAALLCDSLGLPEKPNIRIESVIPPHAGLGSGTQLALAVGRALAELHEISISTREIAAITQRGARSGIGIGVFERGGFVVDLGRGEQTSVPPQLCRAEFPAQWPIVLLHDAAVVGISGGEEKKAFKKLAPMSAGLVAELCRHTLMGVIPAVMERDFAHFATSLAFIQQAIGDYFAPFQGGQRFTSVSIGKLAAEIQGRWPQVVIGQSSWGPTGFVFCPVPEVATEIETAYANGELGTSESQNVCLTAHSARNSGACVTREDGV